MNSRWRTRIFFVAAIGFACLYFLGVKNLPPWGRYRGLYGQMISAVTVYERHATDAVNAVDYDYRGFDTLGEEFLLFASVLGAMLLLRRPERPETAPPPETGLSDAVKVSAAKRLPRGLRLASRLEGRLSLFRQLQSGHPGDYVVWAMVGFVFVGGCLYLLS